MTKSADERPWVAKSSGWTPMSFPEKTMIPTALTRALQNARTRGEMRAALQVAARNIKQPEVNHSWEFDELQKNMSATETNSRKCAEEARTAPDHAARLRRAAWRARNRLARLRARARLGEVEEGGGGSVRVERTVRSLGVSAPSAPPLRGPTNLALGYELFGQRQVAAFGTPSCWQRIAAFYVVGRRRHPLTGWTESIAPRCRATHILKDVGTLALAPLLDRMSMPQGLLEELRDVNMHLKDFGGATQGGSKLGQNPLSRLSTTNTWGSGVAICLVVVMYRGYDKYSGNRCARVCFPVRDGLSASGQANSPWTPWDLYRACWHAWMSGGSPSL